MLLGSLEAPSSIARLPRVEPNGFVTDVQRAIKEDLCVRVPEPTGNALKYIIGPSKLPPEGLVSNSIVKAAEESSHLIAPV